MSQKFKVVETGLITKLDRDLRKLDGSSYQFYEELIDGIPYIRHKAFSSKLVTEDCSIYYLSGQIALTSLLSEIINTDGTKINERDVLVLIGREPLESKSMEASIKYDRFDKMLNVSTPYFNNMLIRGFIDTKTKSISFIQLYINLTFINNWGFISNAIDTDGIRHKVVKILNDTDCSYSLNACELTETIGVMLDEEFLNKHRNGFEIKVSGTKNRIVKVSKNMVEGFLIGIAKAFERIKSGDI